MEAHDETIFAYFEAVNEQNVESVISFFEGPIKDYMRNRYTHLFKISNVEYSIITVISSDRILDELALDISNVAVHYRIRQEMKQDHRIEGVDIIKAGEIFQTTQMEFLSMKDKKIYAIEFPEATTNYVKLLSDYIGKLSNIRLDGAKKHQIVDYLDKIKELGIIT